MNIRLLCGLISLGLCVQLYAGPRMLVYGYNNCMACHVNPDGRGKLTAYGAGVDGAQSWTKIEKENRYIEANNHITEVDLRHASTLANSLKSQDTVNHMQLKEVRLRYFQDFFSAQHRIYMDARYHSRMTNEVINDGIVLNQNRQFEINQFGFSFYNNSSEFLIGKRFIPQGINYTKIGIDAATHGLETYSPYMLMKSDYNPESFQQVYVFHGPRNHQSYTETGIGGLTEFYLHNKVIGLTGYYAQKPTGLYNIKGSLYSRIKLFSTFGNFSDITYFKNENVNQIHFYNRLFYVFDEWLYNFFDYHTTGWRNNWLIGTSARISPYLNVAIKYNHKNTYTMGVTGKL